MQGPSPSSQAESLRQNSLSFPLDPRTHPLGDRSSTPPPPQPPRKQRSTSSISSFAPHAQVRACGCVAVYISGLGLCIEGERGRERDRLISSFAPVCPCLCTLYPGVRRCRRLRVCVCGGARASSGHERQKERVRTALVEGKRGDWSRHHVHQDSCLGCWGQDAAVRVEHGNRRGAAGCVQLVVLKLVTQAACR